MNDKELLNVDNNNILQPLDGGAGDGDGTPPTPTSIEQFWRGVVDAINSPTNPLGTGSTLLKVFHLKEITARPSPVTPHQLKAGAKNEHYQWRSWRLSFLPGMMIEKLRRHKRMNGDDLPMERNDLRAQIKVRPYWVPSTKSYGHRKKFGRGSRKNLSCWCIDVDHHELGYLPVTDEEFENSLCRSGDRVQGDFLPKEEWADPRKGDLFALIDLILKAKRKTDESVQ
jgi:hypothetical protein